MKKLILFLFIGIFIISFASAANFDNVKSFDKDIGKYGKVKIVNWLGLGEDLEEIILVTNTDICGLECSANKEVILHNDGALIDDIRFLTLTDKGKWKKQEIRSYSFSYLGENGDWIKFNEGDKFNAGTYTIKLEGKKKPTRIVDWQIKAQGRWINEWAIWSRPSHIYDELNDSSINWSLWSNATSSAGGGTFSITENTDYMHIQSVATNGGESASASASTTELPDFNTIWDDYKNITFDVMLNFSLECSSPNPEDAYGRINVFGNLIAIAGEDAVSPDDASVWTIIPNTTTVNTFDIFDDGVYNQTITATNNNISFDTFAITDNTCEYLGEVKIFYVYIYPYEGEVTLNSPQDNFVSPTEEVDFNCSSSVAGGAKLTNISLFGNFTGTWNINQTVNITPSTYLGLLSYYRLDETSGPVIDVQNFNNGTNNGATRGVVGKINNSFSFDGSNDYVNFTNISTLSTNISGTYSISLWYNTRSSSLQTILNHGVASNNRVAISLTNGNQVKCGDYNGSWIAKSSDPSLSLNEWHHVVMTKGQSIVNLYVDGNIQTGLLTPSSGNGLGFRIGTDVIGNNPFNGSIDELGIWDRVLSQEEVLLLYNSSNASRPTSNDTFTYVFNNSIANGETVSWSCESCDTDGDCGFAIENRTLNVDLDFPNITIVNPTGTLDYGRIGASQDLNWTIEDANLDSCWYDYNGTNVTVTCGDNSTSFILQEDNLNLTFYANDTTGRINSEFNSWDYKILEINQTFDNTTIEGALQNITALIKVKGGFTISAAILLYEGNATTGEVTALGNDTQIKKENFITPQVGAATNLTFNWSLVLSGGEVINLSTKTQQVLGLTIDNCSTFTNQIMNLTMVDEEDQFALTNTSIEIAINLLSLDRSQIVVNLSGEFNDENPLGICLDKNLSEGVQYSLDAVIKYVSPGYAIEYYNLVDSLLSNETGIEQIILYDLNLSDSTDFQLTFTGEDALPEEDALIFVERQYVAENTFKTVELPKTDSNGQTVLHLVRNDIVYNIRVVKDNVVLGSFSNIIAFCQDFTIGSCAINLNALTNTTGLFNYDEEIGIVYDSPPAYDSTTNIVSFDFTSSDGTTKVVTMNVERRDIFGNISICNNTVVSSSGTTTCNVGNLTETSLVTIISIDGTPWISDTVIIDTTTFGNIGYVIWFILSIALVLMFSESKNGVVISLAISYIGAVSMGLIVGGITGVGSAGIWILVISMVGIWKINRNRKS